MKTNKRLHKQYMRHLIASHNKFLKDRTLSKRVSCIIKSNSPHRHQKESSSRHRCNCTSQPSYSPRVLIQPQSSSCLTSIHPCQDKIGWSSSKLVIGSGEWRHEDRRGDDNYSPFIIRQFLHPHHFCNFLAAGGQRCIYFLLLSFFLEEGDGRPLWSLYPPRSSFFARFLRVGVSVMSTLISWGSSSGLSVEPGGAT